MMASKKDASLVGTLIYMAPEIIAKFDRSNTANEHSTYTNAIDWWSLGVLTYRLAVGKDAFRDMSYEELSKLLPETLSRMPYEQAFYEIMGDVSFDPTTTGEGDALSVDVIEFIKGLLEFDPEKRLCGCTYPHERSTDADVANRDVRKAAFFKNIDWDLMEKKEATPPYTPVREVITSVLEQRVREKSQKKDSQKIAPRSKGLTLTDVLMKTNRSAWIPVETIGANDGEVPQDDKPSSSTQSSRFSVKDNVQHYFKNWNYINPVILQLENTNEKQVGVGVMAASVAVAAAAVAGDVLL